MRRLLCVVSLVPVLVSAAAGTARAQVCVAIDETRDMLSAADRSGAVLLVARQFELEGEHVVPDGCENRYVLSHILLGRTIVATLAGPRGQRDGTALGVDD